MSEKVQVLVRVPKEEKERMVKLGHFAHQYGFTKKNTLSELLNFGMNLAYDACYREALKRRGG